MIQLLLIAIGVGAAVPLQSAVNAQMASHLGHPLYGALTNTAVASLVLLVLVIALQVPAPRLGVVTSGPWWLWSGGLIGAAFVFGALFVAPRIGAASFAAATVFGTVIASLLIDQFGLLGFTVRPLSPLRLSGMACVLGGVLLLQAERG